MNCKKCEIKMKSGKALLNTLTMGVPDFPSNTINSRGQTVTRNGPAREVPCWKCPKCGYSVAK